MDWTGLDWTGLDGCSYFSMPTLRTSIGCTSLPRVSSRTCSASCKFLVLTRKLSADLKVYMSRAPQCCSSWCQRCNHLQYRAALCDSFQTGLATHFARQRPRHLQHQALAQRRRLHGEAFLIPLVLQADKRQARGAMQVTSHFVSKHRWAHQTSPAVDHQYTPIPRRYTVVDLLRSTIPLALHRW